MPPRKPTTRKTNQRRTTWTTRNTTRNITSTRINTTSWPCSSPKFRVAREECQWRIGSYRNVYQQFTGATTKTVFSPTNAGKWMKYITNGVRVYKFNNKDFCKYFGSKWAKTTTGAARNYLRTKYGSAIKDVTRGKSNCWLIAASKTPTARPFTQYHWK